METFIHNPNGHTPFDPLDMAIDPYSRLLYWTCDNQTAINVTRLDGTPVGLVISGKDQKPRLLALMPEKGYKLQCIIMNYNVQIILHTTTQYSYYQH